MTFVAIGLALAAGFVLGHRFANRWIDHHWYCGRSHPASHPCELTSERLEWWNRREARLRQADELEAEAKHLRSGAR